MPLEAPNLDDRRFADLVAEAKSLIPRYAPEWTDHNTSDPGITMIQLFAWLGDVLLYRMNRVPERNYIKFLQLIGIEVKQAVPARAEVTFSLSNPNTATAVVPRGTRMGTTAAQATPSATAPTTLPTEEEKPVVFETDEPIVAIGAALAYVQVYDGSSYSDRSVANAPAADPYYPFGPLAKEGSALLLGFTSVNLFPTDEINLYVRAYFDADAAAATSCAGTTVVAPATIAWEYWSATGWKKLGVLKDETLALTATGHLYFNGPKDITGISIGKNVQTTSGPVTVTGTMNGQLYWLRCRLVASQYEIAPRIDAVLTNTVRATAAVSTRDEVLGSSNGSASQTFTVANLPIYAFAMRPLEERLAERAERERNPPNESEQAALDDKLRLREYAKGFQLEVEENAVSRPWEEVEDFYNSNSDDRHYTLNRTTGVVTFGDGNTGRVPLAGINNIVARFYRYGGGARGNVGSGSISDLQSPVSGVNKVTNNWAAEAGADEESVDDAKARAPKELKARDRAVTTQDYEFLARQTPGVRVRRAHALPLYHPDFPGVEVPGVITVMVIPESEDPKPVPSEGTMKTVCAYLTERRLLTTEVYVAPPKYIKVSVEALVTATTTADIAAVKKGVEDALTKYLHPLTGGADEQGWQLGAPILYSEIFRVVLSVDGVQIVDTIRITLDDVTLDECTNGTIESDELVYSDGHDVTVNYPTAS